MNYSIKVVLTTLVGANGVRLSLCSNNRMLSVVHLSNNDIVGGASRAAYRIHRCLEDNKSDYLVNSSMKVIKKYSNDQTVTCLNNNSYFWKRLQPRISRFIKSNFETTNKSAHSIAYPNTGLLREINNNQSFKNITHLHWLGDNTISIEEVGKLKGPIFWTLHDQWPFCGAEHYTHPPINKNVVQINDFRYRQNYSSKSRIFDEKGFDINRWTWERKKRSWTKPINIVATSSWLFECVKKSSLMKNWPIHLIPYPINTKNWKPINKIHAKNILGIDPKKKVLLFGAIGGTKDTRKGSHILEEALIILRDSYYENIKNGIKILVFGEASNKKNVNNLPVDFLGSLSDDLSLRVVYSAADVMVVPSIQEAFGQTASEAHACATPVVAFNIGGLIDIVSHQQTGYLADPYDPRSLAYGINWTLEDEERNKKLSSQARLKAEKYWDSRIIAKKYVDAYNSVLNIN
tara:strand:+ start:4869 stop:6251 length:1383 start_codon:yes stop_codon:yes gene_type:complete